MAFMQYLDNDSENLEKIELSSAEVLDGAMDIHVHGAPRFNKRIDSDYGLAKRTRDAGHSGIVLKAHEEDTAARAGLLQEILGFPTYGGVVLNCYVRGT